MPLVWTNFIEHSLHMSSLFIITIITIITFTVMFINIIWGNIPKARFHAWRIGTYGFSDHGSWRQPKKRGRLDMVSHLHRNSGIFPRVILVELLLFQHGSTARHKYIGTKHQTMRRKLMKFVLCTVPKLINDYIIYTCCLYTVKHDISLFVHGSRQIELDVVFPEAVHASTILCFSMRGSTSCSLVSVCFKILQLAMLFLVLWVVTAMGFQSTRGTMPSFDLGTAILPCCLFGLKALRQRKSVLVAKDKSCQGYRFRDEMTSITVLTRHTIIINYIWTMIEIWLSVWWDMKPWMNQYANAQLANGLFIFPKSVLCSWCSGTVFNLSSVDTFLQSQSDSWVNDEAAKHVWWRFFFNHEHRVKHVEIWLRQGKETPRLILGGCRSCRCSFLAFVGGIHWWDSHFGNDKDFSGPFQVSSILIVTMTVKLLCFLYIFQHPNENKKLLHNILYTCINM